MKPADPGDPIDPKHAILARIGVLDAVEWVPTGAIYEVRGGPVGQPFVLPDGFAAARAALADRFPSARPGIAARAGRHGAHHGGPRDIEPRREPFASRAKVSPPSLKLAPMVRDWRRSVTEVFDRAFGDNEAVKCALAANLPYWHDDPDTLWWILFAVAQGGYLGLAAAATFAAVRRASARRLPMQRGGPAARSCLAAQVTDISLGADGGPSGVVHGDRDGGEPVEARAPIIVANAAPAVLAAMLPASARERFWSAYADHRLSISLFSATFGLSVRPATLGFRSYSTFLLPPWMKTLSDHRRSADLLGGAPGTSCR